MFSAEKNKLVLFSVRLLNAKTPSIRHSAATAASSLISVRTTRLAVAFFYFFFVLVCGS